MAVTYRDARLGSGGADDPALVRDLQRDLRRLGFLRRTIDGQFGPATRAAVCALQFDLLHNDGTQADDGAPPVPFTTWKGGVAAITGVVDAALADSIAAALGDARVTWLPESADPVAANRAVLAAVSATVTAVAPTPFLLAIFRQESDLQHYAVPEGPNDSDSFVTVGLDRNGAENQVTSRGYGLGQYTIFHHPPIPTEVAGFILDPQQNVMYAYRELRDKFDHFVVGTTEATWADDRKSEHPLLSLRLCRYTPDDPKYMSGCQECAQQVRKLEIGPETPVYDGAGANYSPASYYPDPRYSGVPDRAEFLCDWPYAVRRYNGSGPNSFNYQAIILQNLLAGAVG
jgi:peptidoglycan hydrolase-like protein with peptidoglycan-binding domain